jgi:flagellar biosynthesis protein FlhB
MADEQAQERTEKPSAKRLQDARDKGNVPRSADLVAALSLLAVTTVLSRTGGSSLVRLEARLTESLQSLGDRAHTLVTPDTLGSVAMADAILLATLVGPLMAAGALIGLAGNLVQSGWVFAPDKLTPDWSRLSLSTGFSRFSPSTAGVTVLKATIAVAIVSSLLWSLGSQALAETPRLAWMAPGAAASESWRWIWRLLMQGGMALVLLAGADMGWQWWRHYQSLKMTKQELRDEAKLNDGNPEVKARVRRVQREMTRRRMLAAVKNATVVITNPTHFAVALEYRRGAMLAPTVVAKGQDHMAAKIRELAREYGIPIVENKPLAQALFKGADVGDAIPADLFGAVAEVLAYLVRIKQLML